MPAGMHGAVHTVWRMHAGPKGPSTNPRGSHGLPRRHTRSTTGNQPWINRSCHGIIRIRICRSFKGSGGMGPGGTLLTDSPCLSTHGAKLLSGSEPDRPDPRPQFPILSTPRSREMGPICEYSAISATLQFYGNTPTRGLRWPRPASFAPEHRSTPGGYSTDRNDVRLPPSGRVWDLSAIPSAHAPKLRQESPIPRVQVTNPLCTQQAHNPVGAARTLLHHHIPHSKQPAPVLFLHRRNANHRQRITVTCQVFH